MAAPSEAGLDALVAELAARAAALPAGTWRVGSDETARLLGVDLVSFWREANDLRRRISFGDAIDGFSQDTVGDLVTLLERLVGPSAEEALVRAGLFLPHRLGVELAERLQRACRAFAASHEVRSDDLEGMIRHAGSVRAAVGFYLETYADLGGVIAQCAEAFRCEEGLPPVARATAERWLRHLFAKHVLERRSLFTLLEQRLRLAAARAGHVDPEPRERAEAAAPRRPARRAWALRVMGFVGAGGDPDAADLRVRYRQLMMRHHPDVDPSSLERCKDVNVAYALLISGAAIES
jgi:hypothetical protein